MNSATTSEVLPEPTFRCGLNVWTAGVGGGDGGGAVCGWKSRRKEEGRGRSGCVGMGGVSRWEAGGGRTEGKGGVVDAGFVLPVAYLKNSSNTTNTTWQSVGWHPWLQPKIHPIVRVAKHASFLSVSMLVYISALSIPSPLSSSPSLPSNLAGLAVVACSINTEVQGSGEKRVGQKKLEVVSSSPSAHLGTRPVQVVAGRLIIKTLLC